MCNLYAMTSTQQAIREFTRATRDTAGNLPPLPGIFPDGMAPAAGVAIMRRPTRTNRRCPSQVSRIAICRLTAPWVRPSSEAAMA